MLERVLLFGLEETLPVLELLVDERLDSNSEMIEDARELVVVSVPVVVVSDSVVAVELSSEDLQPKKRILINGIDRVNLDMSCKHTLKAGLTL